MTRDCNKLKCCHARQSIPYSTYVPHTNSPPGVLLLLQAPLCYPLRMWLEAKPVEKVHTMRSNENEYYTQSQSLHHENGSSTFMSHDSSSIN